MSNQIEADLPKKERLFQALIEQLRIQSMDEINISQLCQKAGVSRMYYYRNYVSLEDIVREKLDQMFHDYLLQIEKYKRKGHEAIRVFFFQFFRQFQTELLILLQSDMRYIIHYSFKDYLKVLVNNYFLNEVRPSIEPYWQSYVSAGLADVLFIWILSGAKESDQEMVNIIYPWC